MSGRQNTIVCTFDLRRPRISACEIHELFYTQMYLNDHEKIVQNYGPKRLVYITFPDNERMQDVLRSIGGQVEYRHTNREISIVRISTAGMGARRVRIANLPFGSIE
jgi:hypothetical protein